MRVASPIPRLLDYARYLADYATRLADYAPRLADYATRLAGKPALIFGFLLCALPVGAVFCAIVPAGAPPDESTHVARAAGLLHGAVVATRKIGPNLLTGAPQGVAGVKEPGWLLGASIDRLAPAGIGHDVDTAATFDAARAWTRSDAPALVFLPIPNTAMYFPATYLPAALGLAIGIASGAAPHTCLVLMRLFMLAAFLGLGSWAIAAAAYGEAMFIAVLLLPLTLFLAGSVNQDAVLIAVLCVAASLLTRADRAGRWIAILFLALACGAKPPYLPLAAVLLLPLGAPGLGARLRDLALVAAPVLAWTAWMSATVMVPLDIPPPGAYVHPGPLAPFDHAAWLDQFDPAANLHVLLADPRRFFTIPWATVTGWRLHTLLEMVGLLRARELHLGAGYYAAVGIAAAAAAAGLAAARRPGGQVLRPADHAVAALAILGALWAILLSLYLNFTPVGDVTVGGFVARYALPLLPFLLFVIPAAGRLAIPGGISAGPALACGLVGIAYLPWLVGMNFYLH